MNTRQKARKSRKAQINLPELSLQLMKRFIKYYIFRKNPRHVNADHKLVLPRTSTIETIIKSFFASYENTTGLRVAKNLKEELKRVDSSRLEDSKMSADIYRD